LAHKQTLNQFRVLFVDSQTPSAGVEQLSKVALRNGEAGAQEKS
jgi:hypothetical protein